MARISSRIILLGSFFSLITLVACQHQRREAPKRQPEPYVASAGAVGFDILPLGNADGTRRWIATYTRGGSSTKFRIEITAAKDSDQTGSGTGKLLREPGSDPVPLLADLKSALRANSIPKSVEEAEELPFTYTTTAENRKRSDDGSFAATSKGNWTVLKISIGKNNTAMFLNFDTFDHQAEFAIADPDHGDAALAELAKVL